MTTIMTIIIWPIIPLEELYVMYEIGSEKKKKKKKKSPKYEIFQCYSMRKDLCTGTFENK